MLPHPVGSRITWDGHLTGAQFALLKMNDDGHYGLIHPQLVGDLLQVLFMEADGVGRSKCLLLV